MTRKFLIPGDDEVFRWFERAPGGPWVVVGAKPIYDADGIRVGVRRVDLFCLYPIAAEFNGNRIEML